ncbi:hypothetical protein M9H77_03083 [Catharanthus roseus]|uniref:Uncharacterized protein n=1 Tax=Catharanthus roseus TaxID=4058 RepID=A0ACC0CAE1_CATRO|nr:hypothetical protein M9H77_03083 [Catharanthus roseus]
MGKQSHCGIGLWRKDYSTWIQQVLRLARGYLRMGSNNDEILCDVAYASMHLLLGRPWQYDRRAIHDVKVIEEFKDVFLEEMPCGLPPLRGIEHQIDLVPGVVLPNRPAYRSPPKETEELRRQVEEFLSKGYVRESLSPCVAPVLLVLKKDGTMAYVY